jgi:hypothetical protein
MDLYISTYPELISSAAAERIKRMERAQAAHQVRQARRACRSRRVQRGIVGWTRLGRRTASPSRRPSPHC